VTAAAGRAEPGLVPRRHTCVTGGRTTALLAAGIATLVLALSGCGQARSDATADPPADATSPTGAGDEAGGSATAITAVTVRETGGLMGVDDSTTVAEGADRAGAVFATAAMLPEPAQHGPPAAPCCDLVTYRVTVHYANGDTNTYVTWDGDPGQVLLLARAVLKAPGGK